MDMKLEVVVVPVSDVDRAKAFYGGPATSTRTFPTAPPSTASWAAAV